MPVVGLLENLTPVSRPNQHRARGNLGHRAETGDILVPAPLLSFNIRFPTSFQPKELSSNFSYQAALFSPFSSPHKSAEMPSQD